MSEDNLLSFWNTVEKTDKAHTKQVKMGRGQNAREYTAIDATHQLKNATKKFGKYGETWGLKESDLILDMAEKTGLVIHKAIFFYPSGNKEVTFPIHNAVKAWSMATDKVTQEKYVRTDEDFAKKVETNTVSKALSKLGFNADVFLGKFEDQEYLAELDLEKELEGIDQDETLLKKKRDEFFEWCKKELGSLKTLSNQSAIEQAFRVIEKKGKAKCDALGLPYDDINGKDGVGKRLLAGKTEALKELQNKSQN